MNGWGEYNRNSNDNSNMSAHRNAEYNLAYFGAGSSYALGDNMAPNNYSGCFTETTATTKMRKWTKIFKICSIVVFSLLIVGAVVSSYNASFVFEKGDYYAEYRFSLGYFIGSLIGYGIIISAMFISYKVVCAVLDCLAQITRNTGISAKLAAFNTRNKMMKDASKEENKGNKEN